MQYQWHSNLLAFPATEEKSGPLLHKLIEEAKNKAIELKELSEKDAENVAPYLKRDLSDAAHYLSESGRDLKD